MAAPRRNRERDAALLGALGGERGRVAEPEDDGPEEGIEDLLNAAYGEEPEPEGEDLMGTLERDMRAQPELDRYDSSVIDSEEYEEMGMAERRRVEEELRKRDLQQRGRERRGFFLLSSERDDEDDVARVVRDARAQLAAGEADLSDAPFSAADEEEEEDDDDDVPALSAEQFRPRGPLREWLLLSDARAEIKRRFRRFLRSYQDDSGVPKYVCPAPYC